MKKIFVVITMLCLFCGNIFSQEEVETLSLPDTFVIDNANLLSAEDAEKLNEKCISFASTSNLGIYIVTVPDMGGYTNIEDFSEDFYTNNEFGIGEEKTGIMLIMSMLGRDYDICAHGSFAHYTFTDYGKEVMANSFLSDFKQNDWAAGFNNFILSCEELYNYAKSGTPLDIHIEPEKTFSIGNVQIAQKRFIIALVSALIIALIIAFCVCSSRKGNLNNVKLGVKTDNFISEEKINFLDSTDVFTHKDVSTRVIQTSTSSSGSRSSGGTTISSGGYSHHSGKF